MPTSASPPEAQSCLQEWAPLQHAREQCSLAVIDEELYAVGGYVEGDALRPVPTEVLHFTSSKVVKAWEGSTWGSFGACLALVGR